MLLHISLRGLCGLWSPPGGHCHCLISSGPFTSNVCTLQWRPRLPGVGWPIRQLLALQVLIELNACFHLTQERAAKLALPQWHAAKQVDEVTLAWALLPWESLVKVHRHCNYVVLLVLPCFGDLWC